MGYAKKATEGKFKEAIAAATKIPRIAPLSEVQNVFRSGKKFNSPGTSELTNSPDWGYLLLYTLLLVNSGAGFYSHPKLKLAAIQLKLQRLLGKLQFGF